MVAGIAWRHCPVLALSLLFPILLAGRAEAEPSASPYVAVANTNSSAASIGGFDRVPTASLAMGCAAGAALAAHALYQSLSDRRRARLEDRCAGECPEFRVDHYRESRDRADIALRLGALAAASSLWLAYNDPQEALDRLGQRQAPKRYPGFKIKVKPAHRGLWASVVAYF